jgi:hypothetical protein
MPAGAAADMPAPLRVFLRAEWEYVTFADVNDIHTDMNTGRVGVGVRF